MYLNNNLIYEFKYHNYIIKKYETSLDKAYFIELQKIKKSKLSNTEKQEHIKLLNLNKVHLGSLYVVTLPFYEQNFSLKGTTKTEAVYVSSKILFLAIKTAKKKLRQLRQKNKDTHTIQDIEIPNLFCTIKKSLDYFTHIDSGDFLKLKKEKLLQSLRLDKKPTTDSNYIGVEIEFCSELTFEHIAEILFAENLTNYCTLKRDESLRPKKNEEKHELCILFKENETRYILTKICNILKQIKAETEDRRCGLHVHLDMRNRNKDKVYNNLVACQSLLNKMIYPERRNGEFCKKVYTKKFPENFSSSRTENRYKAINAASYYKHKTIEIRLHEGTTDFYDIYNWIKLLVRIANYGKKIEKNISTKRKLYNTFNLTNVMQIYIRDRINRWEIYNAEHRPPRFRLETAIRPAPYEIAFNVDAAANDVTAVTEDNIGFAISTNRVRNGDDSNV